MAKISDYLENKILDHVLRNTAYSAPTVYMAAHTADPGDTGTSELAGGNYARVAAPTWAAPSSRAIVNSTDLRFPLMIAAVGTITHISAWDAISGGNLLWYSSAITGSIATAVGIVPTFAAGTISVGLGGEISTYLSHALLNLIFRGVSFTPPTPYTSLHTADPGLTGANEVSKGFDSYSGTGLSLNTASKLSGANSFAVNITDTTVRYGQLTVAGDPQQIVAACKVRVSELTMANADTFNIFGLNQTSTAHFFVDLNYTTANGLRIYAGLRLDGAAGFPITSHFSVADGDEIKVVATISTAPGANNGSIALYINGVLKGTVSGQDNDQALVSSIRQGAAGGIDAGTSGTLYMDDIWWGTVDDVEQAQDYLDFEGASGLSTYARVQVTAWDSPSGGATANTSAITYPTPTPSDWGTITYKGIWDAASGGNFLIAANLDESFISQSGTAPVDGAGDFDVVVQ